MPAGQRDARGRSASKRLDFSTPSNSFPPHTAGGRTFVRPHGTLVGLRRLDRDPGGSPRREVSDEPESSDRRASSCSMGSKCRHRQATTQRRWRSAVSLARLSATSDVDGDGRCACWGTVRARAIAPGLDGGGQRRVEGSGRRVSEPGGERPRRPGGEEPAGRLSLHPLTRPR